MHSSNSSHMFKNAEKYCLMSTTHPNKSFVFSIFSRIIHFVMTMFKKAERSDILFNLFSDKAHFQAIFTLFYTYFPAILAWENSWLLAMLLLVSLQNGIWGTTAEIPFWWHIATQIWLVVLIDRPIRSSTQICIVMHHKNGISVLIPQTSFLGETCESILKCGLFSQAFSIPDPNH